MNCLLSSSNQVIPYHAGAPEIHKVGAKRYALVFTARCETNGKKCIGIAFAKNPLGPYKDIGKPLVKYPGVENLDASLARDQKTKAWYILFKHVIDYGQRRSYIKAQALNKKLTGFKKGSKPITLIMNDLPWEHHCVEGPQIFYRKPYYYLFYSGADCCTENSNYAVGVARSKKLTGPYKKKGAPILKSGGKWVGPGHGFVFNTPSKKTAFIYHSWIKDKVGPPSPPHLRVLMLDQIKWKKNWPVISGGVPSTKSRPLPL